MIRLLQCLVVGLALILGTSARADGWMFYGDAKILEVVQWQDNSPVYFKVSPTDHCYVPAAEKGMVALIFSLYASGRRADIHCYTTADTYGGIPGYRLHRIIAR